MSKIRKKANIRLKASTLVELLLTMIISGVIFLLIFDGVAIIKEFSHSVRKTLMANQTLLYSHRFIEYLVENADSVIEREDRLIFYRGGISRHSITIEDTFFLLESNGITDTLFAGYIECRIIPVQGEKHQVDSVCIQMLINANDSVWLEYGTSPSRYVYRNKTEDYEDSW